MVPSKRSQPASPGATVANPLFKPIIFNKDRLILDFTESLTHMLAAGIVLLDALEIIHQEGKNPVLRGIVRQVSLDLNKGVALNQALAAHDLFPPIYLAMIRVGETTGKLREVLGQLLQNAQAAVETREKVFSVLFYPAFLLTLSVGVVAYLTMFIIPKFFGIFQSLQAEPPLVTQIMIGVIKFVQGWGLYLLPVVAIVAILVYRWGRTPAGGQQLERLVLQIPQVGRLYGLFLIH